MIGTNPNLPLPQTTDTYSIAISKVAAWLSAIGVSLGDKATPGGLNINTALDFGGNAATNITSVQLASGNTPGVPGSIFYYNGEFYAIDSTGTIQLTAAGQLNAASVGGIGGDYGGVNPAQVVYDNASGQYRFYTNGTLGTWADLAAAHLVLEGAAATVTLGVDAALNVARIINIKSLPSSGVGLLVYNSATSTIEDIAATSPTAISVTCPVTTTGNVTAADVKLTGVHTHVVPAMAAMEGNISSSAFQHYRMPWGWELHGTNPVHYPVVLPVGSHISAIKLFLVKASPSSVTITVQLYKYDSTTGSLTTVGGGVNDARNSPGRSTDSDITPNVTTAANEQYFVTVAASGVGYLDTLLHLEVSYTRP